MGSLVLTSDQVFSESRFRYGFQLTEFRDQKSGLVPPLKYTLIFNAHSMEFFNSKRVGLFHGIWQDLTTAKKPLRKQKIYILGLVF